MSSPSYLPDSHVASMYSLNGKIMVVAVAALLVVTSLVLLLHVYAKWWFLRHSPRRSSSFVADGPSLSQIQHLSLSFDYSSVDTNDGLDASVVASLPIFIYKSEEHKIAADCVICLSALVEDEKGRILPGCQHVFHVGCIDMWLHSHSTCPICRAGVAPFEAAVGLEELDHDPPQESTESAVVVSDENSYVAVELEVASSGLSLEGQMQIQKDSPSASSPSLLSASSSSSSSSSLSYSLKRMLSRSRSERKVFPSTLVGGS